MTKKKLVESIYESDEASPGLLFWRSFFNWQRLIRTTLDPHNLTQAQYAVMAAILYRGSDGSIISQQDVATSLGMDKMMVSDIVKTLLKKKFIVRTPHPHDARAYALSATALGKRKLEACVPLVESVDEAFFGSVGDYFPHLHEALKLLSRGL